MFANILCWVTSGKHFSPRPTTGATRILLFYFRIVLVDKAPQNRKVLPVQPGIHLFTAENDHGDDLYGTL
jgi:hypothetical protein